MPGWTQSSLGIELVVPVSNPEGTRELSLERYPRIHVILTNLTPAPLKIWKDWNTWGYFNLILTWEAGGNTYLIRHKPPTDWDGDFPDFWLIPPGEKIILEVDMSDGNWIGFPDLYGETIEARLTAIYENKRDILANEFGIWCGRVASASLPVMFK
ncbi:MAG: hypothetical protein SF053_14440 [Bacteroidia bacterium]|nr:hypothetical protein [Bacteroidia bacterium]